MKQMEDADKWAKYLSREYQLDESMLLKNFKVIQTMDEDQMNASIELLKDLLSYRYRFDDIDSFFDFMRCILSISG